jgi:hypothetical protein
MVALTVTRVEAAELCHLSPSGFDVWVRKGIVPGPVAGTRRWSRAAIENAVNGKQHDNDDDPEDAYRRWKESRAG